MFRRPIHDEAMGLALRLAQQCHPLVVQQHAEELARYARLTSACTALESFSGCRPRMDPYCDRRWSGKALSIGRRVTRMLPN